MTNKVYDPKILPVEEARGILSIVQLNKIWPKKEINIKKQFGRLNIRFNWRSKKNLWGRFGGGWNWKLGFQASGRSLIINLLIASLMFSIAKKETTDD